MSEFPTVPPAEQQRLWNMIMNEHWAPNKPQLEAAEAAINPHGKCSIITGFLGSGKTRLAVALVAYYTAIGLNVTMCAKTNDASDGIIEECNEVFSMLPELREDAKPIHGYRPVNEQRTIEGALAIWEAHT